MPESPRKVIVNATPIISLALIGKLALLHELYGEVIVPSAVWEEVAIGGIGRIGATELRQSDWIHVTSLQDPSRADLLFDLDRGEAEVIALAQELKADLVILDERLARRQAKRLRLAVTGTLGILIKAKQRGLIPAVKPLISRLQQGGIRLGDALVAEALLLADET